jgi:23S rRNA (guanine745-N1)-methyltransferase
MHHLICPVCSSSLKLNDSDKSLSCVNAHLFDVAKQGYVNLLLSQHKKSKNPGDTSEMVSARTLFLNQGFYQGIAESFESVVLENSTFDNPSLENDDINRLIDYSHCDLACGEGYYTSRLNKLLREKIEGAQPSKLGLSVIRSSGIDISTPAIKAACRRSRNIQWLVASTARIPLGNNTQDLVSGLFFHFDLKEISRILKPGGILVLANTGANHLIELRQLIYDEVKEEKSPQFDPTNHDLEHIKTHKFRQQKTLSDTTEIMQLLSMTPHYWRTKPEKKKALNLINRLNLSLDIQFDIFKKCDTKNNEQK